MTHDDDAKLLRDAAKVHAVSRDVHEAVAALAVRPLDEEAAVRMREVLGGDHSKERESLKRLRVVREDEGR